MRRFLLIVVAALTLNACTPSTGNPQLDAFLVRVQAIAKQICGVEIIAAQIVALIPNPVAVGAVTVANQICNQVLASGRFGSRRYGAGATGTVNVRIAGNVVALTVRR